MNKPNFGYQYEKLAQARSTLMAPHTMGEDQSFASAFHSCSLAFHQFDVTQVNDENATDWIKTIERLSDPSGIEDSPEGTWLQRARSMSQDEKREFSTAVDELASWFSREFWAGR